VVFLVSFMSHLYQGECNNLTKLLTMSFTPSPFFIVFATLFAILLIGGAVLLLYRLGREKRFQVLVSDKKKAP
jgi:hypothetical protein